VEFHARLREERKFGSVEELAAAIRADVDRARRILSG
jgi:FAD synthase